MDAEEVARGGGEDEDVPQAVKSLRDFRHAMMLLETYSRYVGWVQHTDQHTIETRTLRASGEKKLQGFVCGPKKGAWDRRAPT